MRQLFGQLSQSERFSLKPWDYCRTYTREPGYILKSHQHAFTQLIHILEGELEVNFGDGWMVMHPHDVHILPPRCSHSLRSPGGYKQFGVNFMQEPDERGLGEAITRAFTEPMIFHLYFRESWSAMLQPPVLWKPNAECFGLLHILDEYGIALIEYSEKGSEVPVVRQLLEYINANLTRVVSVNELADAVHMSRASLQRLCKRHFYCGAAHLHTRLRLKRAAEDLLENEVSISDCATRWGYQDVYHFSRAFKQAFGQSPRAYRKYHQEKLMG